MNLFQEKISHSSCIGLANADHSRNNHSCIECYQHCWCCKLLRNTDHTIQWLIIFAFCFQQLYNSLLIYFVPFIIASILTGVWALQINARMISPYLPEHKIVAKYFCIQMVLIICKLQTVVIQAICFAINSINSYKITTRIMENCKFNCCQLFHLFID